MAVSNTRSTAHSNPSANSLQPLHQTQQTPVSPPPIPVTNVTSLTNASRTPDAHSRERFTAGLARASIEGNGKGAHALIDSIDLAEPHALLSGIQQDRMAATGSDAALRPAQLRLHIQSRSQLNNLRKELEGLLRSNQQSNATVREFYGLLLEALGDEHSFAASRLSHADIQTVRQLEQCMRDFPEVESFAKKILEKVDELDREFGKKTPSELIQTKAQKWSDWLRDSVSSKDGISIALAAVAMAGKNVAWYIPKKIVPSSENIPFQAISAMAGLIGKRWTTANGLAATIEYFPATLSQRLWKAAGNSMNTWQGVAQAWDMITAMLALKATGENPRLHEGIGFACSALAVMVQTGMLNSVIESTYNKCVGKKPDDELNPLPAFSQERDAGSVQTSDTTFHSKQDADVEQGVRQLQGGPARQTAAKIGHLLNAFPDSGMQARQQEIQKHSNRIELVRNSIEELSVSSSYAEVASESHSPGDVADGLNAELINNMLTSLENCRTHIGELVGSSEPGHVANQANGLNELLENLKEVKKDLEASGGKDPKTIAFFGVMSAIYVGAITAGNIGPKIGSEILSDLNVRGALNAIGSVPMQTLANGGHLLFKDNPDRSPFVQHVMGYLKAISFTPGEFIPLETGIALSEKGKQFAGKMLEAPAAGWPSASTVRVLQELVRSIANPAFNTLGLGQALKPQHIAGLMVNAAGSALTIALGLKGQGEEKMEVKTQ